MTNVMIELMRPNFRQLKRKPFLLPLLMPLVMFAAAVAAALWLLDARSSTVLVLVRNAEIERSLQANPGLNELGKARAGALVDMLRLAKPERGVDAVYATDTLSTQQTAAPVATRMGVAINVIAAGNWQALLKDLHDNHAGQVVLVVASREQLQNLLLRITSKEWTIDEQDYDSLFVISQSRLSKPSAIRLRY